MDFDFNTYRAAHRPGTRDFQQVPRVVCKDGFSLSIQASSTHYCMPRTSSAAEYTQVEVGFPSERVEEFMPYCESPDDPTGTVYGFVPVEIVNRVVNAHGGMV